MTGWSLCETRNKAGRAVVGQTRVRARRTTGQPRRRFRDAWMTLIDVAYSSGTAGGGSERVLLGTAKIECPCQRVTKMTGGLKVAVRPCKQAK